MPSAENGDARPAFVLADGLLYPMGAWLSAFTEAAMQHIDERLPKKMSIRAVARALRDMRTERDLRAVQRRACDLLRESGTGTPPGEMSGPFAIAAVFPVDNIVPPR